MYSFIIVEMLRLRTSIENSLHSVDIEGAIGFDERFVYTDENDVKHHILRIRWIGSNIVVEVNDDRVVLKELNLPMLTMLHYKIQNYVSDYLDN